MAFWQGLVIVALYGVACVQSTCVLLNDFFGGNGGEYFDDGCGDNKQIEGIEVFKDTINYWGDDITVITGISVKYNDEPAILHGKVPDAGNDTADSLLIELQEGERIIGVIGYAHDLLDRIGFITTDPAGVTRTYGPIGGYGGDEFIVYQDIVSLRGRAADAIDAIGFNVSY